MFATNWSAEDISVEYFFCMLGVESSFFSWDVLKEKIDFNQADCANSVSIYAFSPTWSFQIQGE